MSIWMTPVTVDDLNRLGRNTMVEHLEITFEEIGDDFLTATMPVDRRTCQPDGLLHGGASAALAETLGSVAANLCIDRNKKRCLGLEINANHLRSVTSGIVRGTATAVHIGGLIQVWHTHIHDERQRLICISRLTMAVLEKNRKS